MNLSQNISKIGINVKANVIRWVIIMLLIICAADCKERVQEEDFCSYVNLEDIGQTMPMMNKFLSGSYNNLDENQKLQKIQELITWLLSHPCITDACVLCMSCTQTNPPMSKIRISFDENGITHDFILDIAMKYPFEAVGYHPFNKLSDEFCSYVNEEDIKKTIPMIDDFLSALSDDLWEEQKLHILTNCFISTNCIIDSRIYCLPPCQEDPQVGIIHINVDENTEFRLYIYMTKPLKVKKYERYDNSVSILGGKLESAPLTDIPKESLPQKVVKIIERGGVINLWRGEWNGQIYYCYLIWPTSDYRYYFLDENGNDVGIMNEDFRRHSTNWILINIDW